MAKTPSDKLHRLVRSLTPTEKRYFRIFIRGKTERDSKYQRLFDLLSETEQYDSELIKKEIYGDANKEQKKYPELKAYLFDQLLTALQAFDEDHSVESKVTHLLQGVASLFKRGHYKDCDELLEKAHKITVAYELFTWQLEIFRWKRHLAYTRMDVDFLHQHLEVLDYEERQTLQKLNNLVEYRSLFFTIYAYIKKDAFLRDPKASRQLTALLPLTHFERPEQALSIKAKVLYFRIINLYHYANQDIEAFYQSGKQLIQLIENHKTFISENQSEYIAALFNFILACGILERYSDVRISLAKLRKITPKTEDDRRKIHRQYYSSVVALCQFTGEFEEAREEMIRCKKEAEQLRSKDYETTSFYFQYFYIAFGCGDYEEALQNLNEWLAQPKSVEREDMQSLARMLSLILHFELGNYLLLDSLIRSTKRFLRQKNRLYQLEKEFIHLVNNLLKTPPSEDKTRHFIAFAAKWEQLPGANALNKIFDLKSWVDAKIEGKSFAATVKRKFTARQQ